MPPDELRYLGASDVARALESVDVVDAVQDALVAHARGRTTLPAQAYLAWQNARSICMPAAVDGAVGLKVINANPANPSRGLPRAAGLIVLFNAVTARPVCVMEGARISGLRTAAVTAIAAECLAAGPVERLALLGAGALARFHLELLRAKEIRIYDIDERRSAALEVGVVCASAEEAIRGADLVVAVTTTTTGYIRHDWLAPGALLVNVSLDDPLPEVVLRAGKVFVDDWSHVVADDRRLLGRMFRAGELPAVDGELGQILIGANPGRTHADEVVVVNPFGIAIEDIAVARRVHGQALRLGLGTVLSR